jgi:hypothetical protein
MVSVLCNNQYYKGSRKSAKKWKVLSRFPDVCGTPVRLLGDLDDTTRGYIPRGKTIAHWQR